jgi:hypothetical protein
MEKSQPTSRSGIRQNSGSRLGITVLSHPARLEGVALTG